MIPLPPLLRPIPRHESRDHARLAADYLQERALAERLRHAPAAERTAFYAEVYASLFRDAPALPFLEPSRHRAARELKVLARYLRPETRFVEIGCGGGHLAQAVACRVADCTALDVTPPASLDRWPANARFQALTGVTLPLEDASAEVVYSNQVIEHLHPEDAAVQLRDVRRILAPGGVFLCRTPNRLTGPHDVSRCFADVAEGLHLKEYGLRDLAVALRAAGFSRVRKAWCEKGIALGEYPLGPFVAVERAFAALPVRLRRPLADTRLPDMLINVTLAAYP